jgi:hypothetical protein
VRTRLEAPRVNVVFCGALSIAYLLAAYWVVFQLRIGPVVAVISSREGWGIHTGDVLGVAAAAMGALLAVRAATMLERIPHQLRRANL